jgi:myo-inositol-hexaphosphate 3-phosphohydrolase
VAQDGDNAPDAQNFKLASWAEILKALRAAAP